MNIGLKLSKLIKTILVVCTLMATVGFVMPVSAEDVYTVYDITTAGQWNQVGQYGDFNSAKGEMQKYSNGVMTNGVSKSRTQIIAMTRGIAVSYSFRFLNSENGKAAVTMEIYQYPLSQFSSSKNKQTYVTSHKEMTYLDTIYDPTAGFMAKVNIGGFEGYVYIDQVDLIPYVYYENKLSIDLGGNRADGKVEEFSIVPIANYFEVNNGMIYFKSYSYYNLRSLTQSAIGYKADWMENGRTYYSTDFVHYYTDIAKTQYAGTFYNYYMYLPLRSKSNVTGEQFDAFLAGVKGKESSVMHGHGNDFVSAQETYGVNALLLYALACLEGDYGCSSYATNRNNLYGWSAVDSDPGQATYFASVKDSVDQMAGINLRKYMDVNYSLFFGDHLGSKSSGFNVKYSSDPCWGVQIAAIAFAIDQKSGNVDYNSYTLGTIKDSAFNASVYSSTDHSNRYFTTAYGSTYQKDFTVIVNNASGADYQIQSCNPIQDGVVQFYNKNDKVCVPYDFAQSVGYIAKDSVGLINGTDLNNVTVGFTTQSMNVSGYNFNSSMVEMDDVTVSLVFTDVEKKTETVYPLTLTSLENGVTAGLNVGAVKNTYKGFVGANLDLSSLASADYTMAIRTAYPKYDYSIDSAIKVVADASAYNPAYSLTLVDGTAVFSNHQNEERVLYTAIEDFSYGTDENANKLHLQGVIAVSGVSHNDVEKIVHRVTFYNVVTGEEYVYPLSVDNHESLNTYEFYLGDGTNYYYSWFDNYLDLSTLPVGDYRATLYGAVTEGSTVYYGTKQLSNNVVGGIPEVKTIGEKTFVINKNGKYLSRYEISVTTGLGSVLTQIHKPTARITNQYLDEMTVKDGKISLSGFMYMYRIDHSESSLPVYTLHFVKDGADVLQLAMETNTGLYDVSSNVDKTHDYSHCWYQLTDADISSLEDGTYQLYISISNGEYYDFVRLLDDFKSANQTNVFNEKNFTVTVNNKNYNSITLTIGG